MPAVIGDWNWPIEIERSKTLCAQLSIRVFYKILLSNAVRQWDTQYGKFQSRAVFLHWLNANGNRNLLVLCQIVFFLASFLRCRRCVWINFKNVIYWWKKFKKKVNWVRRNESKRWKKKQKIHDILKWWNHNSGRYCEPFNQAHCFRAVGIIHFFHPYIFAPFTLCPAVEKEIRAINMVSLFRVETFCAKKRDGTKYNESKKWTKTMNTRRDGKKV